jgi:hypothetical protein
VRVLSCVIITATEQCCSRLGGRIKSALIPIPSGTIPFLESTKAEYKERQPAVQKFNVCSTFVDRPSSPLDRTRTHLLAALVRRYRLTDRRDDLKTSGLCAVSIYWNDISDNTIYNTPTLSEGGNPKDYWSAIASVARRPPSKQHQADAVDRAHLLRAI